jgi:hypothetical protein
VTAVGIYVSDFGTHRVIADRFSSADVCMVVDTNYWSLAYLRPFNQKPLADTGDSMKRLMNVEYTLVAQNKLSSGIVADITTS